MVKEPGPTTLAQMCEFSAGKLAGMNPLVRDYTLVEIVGEARFKYISSKGYSPRSIFECDQRGELWPVFFLYEALAQPPTNTNGSGVAE